MRVFLIVTLAAGALTLAGTEPGAATPASGAVMGAGASTLNSVVEARCGRWHVRYCRHGVCHLRRWCHY